MKISKKKDGFHVSIFVKGCVLTTCFSPRRGTHLHHMTTPKKTTVSVFLTDPKTGHIWVNRRAADKPYEPLHLQSIIGKCEEGEDPVETAIRETMEESGIKLTKKELIPVGVHSGDAFNSHMYIAHGSFAPKDLEPHKVAENWKLMSPNDIRKDGKLSCVLEAHIG